MKSEKIVKNSIRFQTRTVPGKPVPNCWPDAELSKSLICLPDLTLKSDLRKDKTQEDTREKPIMASSVPVRALK